MKQTDLEDLILEAEAAKLPYETLTPIETIIGYMELFNISLEELKEAINKSDK